MYYYKMYGLIVCSEFEMQAGYPALKQEYDVMVRMIKEDEVMPKLHIPDRQLGVVKMIDDTIFWIRNGREIIIKPSEKTDWFNALQFVATECLPVILFQREIFTIHGSCIELEDKAIVITGESGAGKSSLANEFVNSGYRMLADDTVGIRVDNEGVFTIPSFPQRRLVEDLILHLGMDRTNLFDLKSSKKKYVINIGSDYCDEPRRFMALVWLIKYQGEKVMIREVTGGEKLKFLMETSYEYRLYANDKLRQNEIMDMVKICNEVVFLNVFRPNEGYTTKEQMRQIVTKLL